LEVSEFNPYQEWLGLAADKGSPNYYELLGLENGEGDLEQIAVAGDRAATRVRSYRPGPHARQWSQLLDEIFAAKSCLLDPPAKAAYDQRLVMKQVLASRPSELKADRQPPAKTPVDGDRYPPGMAPPGARTTPVEPIKSVPESEVAHEAAIVASAVPESPATAAYLPGDSIPTSAGHTASSVPMPNPVPMAMPVGGYAAPYAQPAMSPQYAAPYVQQAPYAMPAGYAAQPYGTPAAYGYAQPMGYGQAVPMAVPPPAPPPQTVGEPMAHYGAPAYGAPGYGGQGYVSSPMPLDPMAPVAIPGYGAAPQSPQYAGEQRIVGFAGAVEPLPQAVRQAIPVGTAVASVAAPSPSLSEIAPAATPAGFSQVASGAPAVSSAVLAAEQELRNTKALQRNILIGGIGGGVLLVVALLVYANLPQATTEVAENPAESNPTTEAPQPMARTIESPLPGGPKTMVPPPGTPATPPQPSPLTVAPLPEPMPPMPQPTVPTAPETTTPAPTPMPEPMVPAPAPTPEPLSPEPRPEPPTPAPMPEPMPAAEMSPAELAALGKALTLGKAAVTEQNFAEADQYLVEAESLARTEEHRKLVARLKEVANYVKQFRQAVVLAATEMEAGEAFKVGTSTLVALVEATPEKIIVRHTGQNKSYSYADLPPGLAAAISDFKLDSSDPVSRVVKGSFYAVAKGDRAALHEKAETWWKEAELGGVDVSHLLPFLTDNYDLVGTGAGSGDKPDAAMPVEGKSASTKSKTTKSKVGEKADDLNE
jgi:hypothetical protein